MAKTGWWGSRVKDRSSIAGRKRPSSIKRHCPPDFRETYIREGWAVQYIYATRSSVVARWIDECGGEELVAERRAYFLKHCVKRPLKRGNHVKGWSAERIEQHHRAQS